MVLDWKYWKSILQKTYLNCRWSQRTTAVGGQHHMANIGCKPPPSGPSIFGSVLWSRSPCAKQSVVMNGATGKDSKGPVESKWKHFKTPVTWVVDPDVVRRFRDLSQTLLTAQLAEVVQHRTAKASQQRQPTADIWQQPASCFPRQLSMHAWLLALVQLASAEVLCWRDSVPQRCGQWRKVPE